MNYYEKIKHKLIDNEIYNKVKDYSRKKYKIKIYLEIGKLLNDADVEYGEGIIKQYSKQLTIDFGKKYTTSLLYKIKQFYNISEKVPTLSGKLTWSHWYEMLSIKDINKINYYVSQCEINNFDVRTLRTKIKSNEYERLDEVTKNKLIMKDKATVVDFVKNPIFIKNSSHYEIFSEKILQKLILENIETFMKELGNNFSFIGSEYKIKMAGRYNYIDILLFRV